MGFMGVQLTSSNFLRKLVSKRIIPHATEVGTTVAKPSTDKKAEG